MRAPVALLAALAALAALGWLAWSRPGLLPPGWPFRAPPPAVVDLPPAPASPRAAGPEPAVSAASPAGVRPAAGQSVERWALEAGPFPSAAAADVVEVELNRLGHGTVRFRRQDAARLFVVTLPALASLDEARRLVQQLGRGTIVQQGESVEVRIGQHATLGDAVAEARPLRLRGLEVRVTEALTPSTVYHVRSAPLPGRAEAQALRDTLARLGIAGQVVKIP
jgi:hypothetical protein